MSIAVLLPTRNRPERLRAMIKSALQSAKRPELLEFAVYVDDDDEVSVPALQKLNNETFSTVKWLQGPRCTLSSCYDKVLDLTTNSIIMISADDILFNETPNWDEKVIKAFEEYEDGIVMAGFKDGYNKNICTHPFISRKLKDILGRIVPEYFAADYADTWLTQLHDWLGRRIVLDGMVRHYHFAAGNAEVDTTMAEKLQRTGLPGLIYQATEQERIAEAVKLRKYIEGFYNGKV